MPCPVTLMGNWNGRYYYYCTQGTPGNDCSGAYVTASDNRAHTCGCNAGACKDPISSSPMGGHVDQNSGDAPKTYKRDKRRGCGFAFHPSEGHTPDELQHNFTTASLDCQVIFDAVARTDLGKKFRLILVAFTIGGAVEYHGFGREGKRSADVDVLNGGAYLEGVETPGLGRQIVVEVSAANLRNVDPSSSGTQELVGHALPDPVVFNCLES